MNTIGSHPGAIVFRLGVMLILIASLIAVFLDYLDDNQQALERQSILQTKKIIDSSLAVVFASYATSGRLAELDGLDGGNPFQFLRQFEIEPPAYRGEIARDPGADLAPGWYYLTHRREVVYKSFYLPRDSIYRVSLSFDDINQSGRFEPGADRFRGLGFIEVADARSRD